MGQHRQPETLGEKRYATLILRLVLDQQGRLMHGELVDVAGGFSNRFVAWRGLIHALRAWLTYQEKEGLSEDLEKG